MANIKLKIFYIISLLLSIIAICTIFTDVSAITKNDQSVYVLTGLQATFGYVETMSGLGMTITTVVTKFSILNLLTYVCLFIGLILTVLKLTVFSKYKVLDFIIIGIFALSTILYLFMPAFVVYGDNIGSLVSMAIENGAKKTLMIGSIIGSVMSFVAMTSSVVKKIIIK